MGPLMKDGTLGWLKCLNGSQRFSWPWARGCYKVPLRYIGSIQLLYGGYDIWYH